MFLRKECPRIASLASRPARAQRAQSHGPNSASRHPTGSDGTKPLQTKKRGSSARHLGYLHAADASLSVAIVGDEAFTALMSTPSTDDYHQTNQSDQDQSHHCSNDKIHSIALRQSSGRPTAMPRRSGALLNDKLLRFALPIVAPAVPSFQASCHPCSVSCRPCSQERLCATWRRRYFRGSCRLRDLLHHRSCPVPLPACICRARLPSVLRI